MTTATTRTKPTLTARAKWHDTSGNTQTLHVWSNGRVAMLNQHGIATSLANVMFATRHNGYAAQEVALREACAKAKDSADLARIATATTGLSGWVAA